MNRIFVNIILSSLFLLIISCSNDDGNKPVGRIEWSEIGCEEQVGVNETLPYICLDWYKAENVHEYVIYYSETLEGEYIELDRTTELAYKNSELTPNKTYFFYVVGYNSSQWFGERSPKKEGRRVEPISKVTRGYSCGSGDSSQYEYPTSLCISWSGGGPYSEEFIIYYSESEDGDFSELARTTRNIYINDELDYGKTYFFYVVSYSSEYGASPPSDIMSSKRYQKYTSTTTTLDFSSTYTNHFVLDMDIYSSKSYMLYGSDLSDFNILTVDINTGNTISSFADASIDNPRVLMVDSNENLHFLDNNSRRLLKYDPVTEQRVLTLNSIEQIRAVEIDKVSNLIYLQKVNANTLEIYDTNYNFQHEIQLPSDYSSLSLIGLTKDAIYIIGKSTPSAKPVLLVYSKEGDLIDIYDINKPLGIIYGVDSEGNIFSIKDHDYLIKSKVVDNIVEDVSYVLNAADAHPYISIAIDSEDNVYVAANGSSYLLRKLTPAE